jgi:hypothetical protein
VRSAAIAEGHKVIDDQVFVAELHAEALWLAPVEVLLVQGVVQHEIEIALVVRGSGQEQFVPGSEERDEARQLFIIKRLK